jgi:hypothetical protein
LFSLRVTAAAGGRCGWVGFAGYHLTRLTSAVCEPLYMLIAIGMLTLQVLLVLLLVGALKVPAVEALLNVAAD